MALAVITGGATGIGAAAVRTFAAEGYDVALLDINGEELCVHLMIGLKEFILKSLQE